MWKNGQCVTVCGKRCRVKSVQRGCFACDYCALDCDDDADCDSICFEEKSKLDGDQYLEEIPAKGKVLAK